MGAREGGGSEGGNTNQIRIVNAKEHNLKSRSVNIPRGKFSVVTGVSGSGKSTRAFDILFNEGQRRYLESLNAYARSIVQPAGRPEVDAVYNRYSTREYDTDNPIPASRSIQTDPSWFSVYHGGRR